MATDYRQKLFNLMVSTIADREHWSYHAIRPLPVPPSWQKGQYVVADCSKGVQYLCRWAGAPDPMGNHFGPYGNSTTICLHLAHLTSPGELMVGDIVTIGVSGNEHAAMVMKAGSDPTLWSFGHQGAPNSYVLSADRRSPKQYLRLPVPLYQPTPEDKLRAQTGWFAWAAWKLGEGDWKDHGKANRKVRPDVPKLIPPEWWKRYAKFLLDRKKGNDSTEP